LAEKVWKRVFHNENVLVGLDAEELECRHEI